MTGERGGVSDLDAWWAGGGGGGTFFQASLLLFKTGGGGVAVTPLRLSHRTPGYGELSISTPIAHAGYPYVGLLESGCHKLYIEPKEQQTCTSKELPWHLALSKSKALLTGLRVEGVGLRSAKPLIPSRCSNIKSREWGPGKQYRALLGF